MKDFYDRQIQEKEAVKENLSRSKAMERNTYMKLENDINLEKQNIQFEKKLKIFRYKNDLDQQISNKKETEFMTNDEKKINFEILRLRGEN